MRGVESESSSNASTEAEQAAAVFVAEKESVESENNVSKRPVWNKPSTASNGLVEIGRVMGADSWPDLSESTARVSSLTKPSADSLEGLLFDGSSSSVSVSQGTETASSSSQKQVNNTANPNSTPNNAVPACQKSMKRNGVNTASNGGTHSPGSQSAAGEGHLNNSSSRDHAQKSSQSRGSNDHPQQQRTSFRNRNGGLHSRGDGSHHHSYGGRRNDLDLANHDWNAHRNFSRDGHMQPLPRVAPRHMRHPPPPPPSPATSPFIAPPPVRPFGLVGFPDMGLPLYYVSPHPGSMRGVPIIAAPVPSHTVLFPSDPQLHIRILHQIDYYFRCFFGVLLFYIFGILLLYTCSCSLFVSGQ